MSGYDLVEWTEPSYRFVSDSGLPPESRRELARGILAQAEAREANANAAEALQVQHLGQKAAKTKDAGVCGVGEGWSFTNHSDVSTKYLIDSGLSSEGQAALAQGILAQAKAQDAKAKAMEAEKVERLGKSAVRKEKFKNNLRGVFWMEKKEVREERKRSAEDALRDMEALKARLSSRERLEGESMSGGESDEDVLGKSGSKGLVFEEREVREVAGAVLSESRERRNLFGGLNGAKDDKVVR